MLSLFTRFIATVALIVFLASDSGQQTMDAATNSVSHWMTHVVKNNLVDAEIKPAERERDHRSRGRNDRQQESKR